MNAVSPYLNTGNLHFKPISARIARGSLWATTTIEQESLKRRDCWKVALHVSSRVLLIAGALLSTAVAAFEATALFLIGGLGLILNKICTDYRSEFLQRQSLQCLSYSMHSVISSVFFSMVAWRGPILRYHTPYVIVDHVIHLCSAGFTQCALGGILDQRAGRTPQVTAIRTLNLLSESHPHLLNDILDHVQSDFDLNLRDRMRNIPHFEDYLNRNPEMRQFIETFSVQMLIQNTQYRQQALTFARHFLAELQLIRPGDANPLLIELNQHTPEEAQYQERLRNFLKGAFLEIHRTPALSQCLDQGGNSGPDLLEMLDAAIYLPLTQYAQYKELLEEITCPAQFTGNLVRYNARDQIPSRRTALLTAKAQIEALSPQQRALLIQKILRGAHFIPPINLPPAAIEQILSAYRAIGILADPLTQGPLVTKVSLDLRQIDAGGNIMEASNLFQKACQEAIAEISAGQPQG